MNLLFIPDPTRYDAAKAERDAKHIREAFRENFWAEPALGLTAEDGVGVRLVPDEEEDESDEDEHAEEDAGEAPSVSSGAATIPRLLARRDGAVVHEDVRRRHQAKAKETPLKPAPLFIIGLPGRSVNDSCTNT